MRAVLISVNGQVAPFRPKEPLLCILNAEERAHLDKLGADRACPGHCLQSEKVMVSQCVATGAPCLDGRGVCAYFSPGHGLVRAGAGVAAVKLLCGVDIHRKVGAVPHQVGVADVVLGQACAPAGALRAGSCGTSDTRATSLSLAAAQANVHSSRQSCPQAFYPEAGVLHGVSTLKCRCMHHPAHMQSQTKGAAER